MQKIVCNSSPIIHLAKIGELNLLKDYFQEIIIPKAVYIECIDEGGISEDVELIKNADWIKVLEVNDRKIVTLLQSILDDGESEAIALSLEIEADLILLDDSDAREKARLYGLKITGVIGILLRAKKDKKIISLKGYITSLKETGFYLSDNLVAEILKFSEEE